MSACRYKHFLLINLASLCFLSGALAVNASEKVATQETRKIELLFLRKIKPLLKHKCFGCHGEDPKKIKADYNMLSRAGMLKGGDSEEAAIIPGAAHKSPVMEMLRRNEDIYEPMPPKDAEKLTAAQIGWIEEWINAGAPWPDDSLLANDKTFIQVKTSGALSEDWANRRYKIEDLWAYRPVANPEVPKSGKTHPIDNFIMAKAESVAPGVGMTDKATKAQLIRRAYLTLTGLAPTFEEIEAFKADTSKDAFEKVINRLEASKHYGEQMARMWLDVTRYADSNGYANDYERPNAWRYRDYVIRSFNQDKPFDQFAMEQIAGDEMDPTVADNVIATGFLRMGAWEHTSMSVKEITRQLFLDDVTETVGKTFLAQPLGCAKCHDHKFDPIPTKDYYRIQAVFASTQFAHRRVPFTEEEKLYGKDDVIREANEKIAHNNAYFKKVSTNPDMKGRFNALKSKQKNYFDREKLRYEPYAFAVYNGPNVTLQSATLLHKMPSERSKADNARIAARNKRLKAQGKGADNAKGEVPETFILTGGSIESPSEKVTPGILSAMDAMANKENGVTQMASFSHYNQQLQEAIGFEGRRLAFAKWVASSKNSMTPRVIVNRIWQMHFNKGIVKTPSSFGVNGAKPTHPRLLDYLATWFMNNGWSIKSLHKHIMTADVYQLATDHAKRDKLAVSDPNNNLFLYQPPRRQQAEMIYDSLLQMSGELNPDMGGPGVFPEINWEVALQSRLIMGTLQPVYHPSSRKNLRHRRQIYAHARRSISDPMLEVFNKPGSELSCARRDETTVTPQAFALFNSEWIHNRALAIANKLAKTNPTTQSRIEAAFKTIYGRTPTDSEMAASEKHIQKMISHHRQHTPEKHELPLTHSTTLLDEGTGLPMTWVQLLPSIRHYERDLMPWDVSPDIRAFSELCLVMINSNEFLYMY